MALLVTPRRDTGAGGHNEHGVGPWQLLVRLFGDAVLIGFFVGQKWALKSLISYTHMGEEWWARWLMAVSAFFAVVAFTVFAGSELVVFCAAALRLAWRAIKGKES